MNNEYIFSLIKEQNFDKIYNIIKDKKILNLNIKDSNNNYLIQYIINFNKIEIIELLISMKNIIKISLDILDIDGRSILYNCIKYNYDDLSIILLKYDNLNIGISIIDIKDRLGLTSLHYAIIFNNFEIFKYLLLNNADPYILTNNNNNAFHIIIKYKRYEMLLYLVDNNYHFNFVDNKSENLLQSLIDCDDFIIQEKIYNKIININNQNINGLTILHQFGP